jgi:hypothetical protein
MTNADLSRELLQRLAGLRPLSTDLRFGQLLATLGWLGEDMTGRTLWDIEDEELLQVVERFHQDLARRQENIAEPVALNKPPPQEHV